MLISNFKEETTKFWKESKEIIRLSVPIFASSICFFGLTFTDNVFLGHLGTFALASGAIAGQWSWILGWIPFCLAFGMDTLVSQAWGAKNYRLVGTLLQNALVTVSLAFIIALILGLFTQTFLRLLGQSEEVSKSAELFAYYLLPGLLPLIWFRVLNKWLQNQGYVLPGLVISAFILFLNVFFNYLFIFPFEMGFIGSALATSVSRFLLPILLISYTWWRNYHKTTWFGWSKEAIDPKRLYTFIKFGILGGLMVLFDVLCFAGTAFFAGKVGEIPLASHSALATINSLLFSFPMALSVGASTRVGSLLGAGKPFEAKYSARVSILIGSIIGFIYSFGIIASKSILGKIYGENPEVIALTSSIAPFSAGVAFFDNYQSILAGILRGAGKPTIGTIFNFIGFGILGIPLIGILAFLLNLGLTGVWLGLMLDTIFISIGETIFIGYIDWEKQSKEAISRSEKIEEASSLIQTQENIQMNELNEVNQETNQESK